MIDVGTGQGGFVNGLANYIEEQIAAKELPKDINVHIIGLTAQEDVPYGKEKVGNNCTKYMIGNFNAENFETYLPKLSQHGLNIKNKIDLAVSKLMLVHLIDPIGTLIEIYGNLRPNLGIIYADRFAAKVALLDDNTFETTPIEEILPWSNVRFLVDDHYFLLQRVDETSLQIPLRYGKLEAWKPLMSGNWLRATYILTNTSANRQLRPYSFPYGVSYIYGSPNSYELYLSLKVNSEEFGPIKFSVAFRLCR